MTAALRRCRQMLAIPLKAAFYRPVNVRHATQTVYQCLLAALNMYRATGSEQWRQRALALTQVLVGLQLEGGGFETRYNYSFGKVHRVGEPLACEQFATVALVDAGEQIGFSLIETAVNKSVRWIADNAVETEGGLAVPYAPTVSRRIYIYNGVSFCVGALGRYLGQPYAVKADWVRSLYGKLIRYVDSVLATCERHPGRYWAYNDQANPELTPLDRAKVDYYHQAMQIDCHARAQLTSPDVVQEQVVRDAADYIVAVHADYGILPYCNLPAYFGTTIHAWGLSAVIPAMISAGRVCPDRRPVYAEVGRFVLQWLLDKAWADRRFYDILWADGRALSLDYQVRSDAWVVNALTCARLEWGMPELDHYIETTFTTLESSSFSGSEKHAKGAVRLLLERFEQRAPAPEWSRRDTNPSR